LNQSKKTGKRKAKVGAQLTWRETLTKLGGREELTQTLVELYFSAVRGRRGTVSRKRQNERVRVGNGILGYPLG